MRAVSPPQRGWGFREGVGKRSLTLLIAWGARMVARERSGKRGAAIAEHEREGKHLFWSGVVCSPRGKASTERARVVGGVYRRSAATEVVYRPEHAARAPHISMACRTTVTLDTYPPARILKQCRQRRG